MAKGRLLKEGMKRHPLRRRKRGRPTFTWAEEIRGLMGENGLVEEDWNDRHNWGIKIIQLINGQMNKLYSLLNTSISCKLVQNKLVNVL
jgi:hypothetical protein